MKIVLLDYYLCKCIPTRLKEMKEVKEGLMAQKREELKQRLEKEKEERRKEKEVKKEQKRLHTEYMKDWRRPRDDLDVDDHKVMLLDCC